MTTGQVELAAAALDPPQPQPTKEIKVKKIAIVTWWRKEKGHVPFNWRAVFSHRWYQNHMARRGLYF